MEIHQMQVVLASASPRRRELLTQVGVDYVVDPSGCEEVIRETDPESVVKGLSRDKAFDTASRYGENTLIIGADTVVASEGRIFGKPSSEEEAFSMINLLKNSCHSVFTGVTIVGKNPQGDVIKSFAVETKVYVMDMSDQEIWDYIKTGEPMDKAGAYGIQGRFAEYVSGIQGDYNNVVGLPVSQLLKEIKLL